MRNNFKKFAALALVLVMLVSTFVPAFATTDACPGVNATHTATNCDYTVVGTKDATCTEPGYETGRCSTCNKQFTVATIPATGHTWSEGKGDCTTGVTKTCESCGLKEAVTAADGHSWSEWIVTGDVCAEGAQAQRVCGPCGQKQVKVMTEEHNWELVEYTAPAGCTEAGSASYKCGSKGCTATKTEAIWTIDSINAQGIGHSWKYIPYVNLDAITGNPEDAGVPACQAVSKDIVLSTGVVITKEIWNSYVKKYVPHTCLGGMVEPMICVKCGAYQEDGIAPIPANQAGIPGHGNSLAWHDFSVYVEAKLPTCTESGTVAYYACSRGCGTYKYNTTQVLANVAADKTASVVALRNLDSDWAITHKLTDLVMAPQHWNFVVESASQAATCTVPGTTAYYCVLCGNENVKSFEFAPAKGHVYYVDLSAEDQAELMQKAITEAALAHLTGATPSVANFTAAVNNAILRTTVNPTCIAAGYTTYGCLECGAADAVKTVAGSAALGHVEAATPSAEKSIAASCESNGVNVYVCKYCGIQLRNEAVDVLGHNMTGVVVIKAATCQAEGEYIAVCKRADCKYAAKNVAADGYVEVAAGVYVHVDLSENHVAIPKAHTWVERNADGTAGAPIVISCADEKAEARTYDRICTTCNSYELGVVYDAVDHVHFDFATSYAYGLVSQAVIGTCTTQGVWYIKCAGCNGAPVKYVDPYTGNGHNKLVLIDAKAPTCYSEADKAWTEAWVCLDCNAVQALKFVPNTHTSTTTGNVYSFADILINKNGIDIYAWDVANRKLGTKYTTVTEVTTEAMQELVVAVKRGAKIVDGLPVNADDYVKEIALSDTVKWCFYVPGTCTTKGYYGGMKCTLCNNEKCYDGVSNFQTKVGGNNNSDFGHVREAAGSAEMTCTQYGYNRYVCVFCDEAVQMGYEAPAHNFTSSEDDTVLEPTCELDGYYTQYCPDCGTTESVVVEAYGHMTQFGQTIVNSCIDRTGDRYCVICAQNIAKDHKFGDWTEADGVKTRTCADCAYVETEVIETEAPETQAPETQAPVTQAPETQAPETQAPETQAPETQAPTTEKGCGGSIAAIAVALVATLGTCVVFAGKKRD